MIRHFGCALFSLSLLAAAIAQGVEIPNGMSPAATAVTTTSASVTTSSVQLVGSNPRRKGFLIWNNSANSAYLTFGPASSSATCSQIIATFASYSCCQGSVVYTGPISAIRNSGSGTLTVTELQ